MVKKPRVKRPLCRRKLRFQDNIEPDLNETRLYGIDWITMAQYGRQWKAIVNTVMNIRFPNKAAHFWTNWLTISFSNYEVNKINYRGTAVSKYKSPKTYRSSDTSYRIRCEVIWVVNIEKNVCSVFLRGKREIAKRHFSLGKNFRNQHQYFMKEWRENV